MLQAPEPNAADSHNRAIVVVRCIDTGLALALQALLIQNALRSCLFQPPNRPSGCRCLPRSNSGHDDECPTRTQPKVLTRREREVLQPTAAGASTDAIADSPGVSRATARNHIHEMPKKLDARRRVEAVALARRNGLL